MSSTSSSSSIGSFEHAKELLAEGKRDLLVHAIPDAVSNCSKACEIMAKHKGEMATEMAEAYFYYGKSLLELSRVESGVLGNALDGVDMETKSTDVKDALVEDTEAMTTDERSEIEEKVADALELNFEKHDVVARAHTGDNTEEESEEDEVMEGDLVSDEMETDVEKAEAEAGNLEQAWQMFDLAKVIYGKAGDVAKECESLTFLGEVSLENSNFKQAVEDLTLCLGKRIKALPADSRSIAEIHYQLGVAQAHCAEYASAEKSLEAAVTVLNTRIANLKKMGTSDDITKELAELALLCTEIKERMADHKEMQKGTYKADNDFVSIFKGAEVHEISTKKAVSTA
jgi:tetratricopeptide (TPR) repeat protein